MSKSSRTRYAVLIVIFMLHGLVNGQVTKDVQKQTIKLVKTENKSCMSDQKEVMPPENPDSVFYSVNGDTLILNMMLYRNCASVNKDSVVIVNGKVSVYIQNTSTRRAKCDCYFCFAFYFKDYLNETNFQLYYKGNKDNDFSLKGNYYLP